MSTACTCAGALSTPIEPAGPSASHETLRRLSMGASVSLSFAWVSYPKPSLAPKAPSSSSEPAPPSMPISPSSASPPSAPLPLSCSARSLVACTCGRPKSLTRSVLTRRWSKGSVMGSAAALAIAAAVSCVELRTGLALTASAFAAWSALAMSRIIATFFLAGPPRPPRAAGFTAPVASAAAAAAPAFQRQCEGPAQPAPRKDWLP
mmetsp:Transcript_4288/g.10957  ORF Transcript_4288/g.10957 Transcript_4288/m.10957 type:complete len:206 (+) Transcript_4288:276-893(+)